jgi:hypothetical protein
MPLELFQVKPHLEMQKRSKKLYASGHYLSDFEHVIGLKIGFIINLRWRIFVRTDLDCSVFPLYLHPSN